MSLLERQQAAREAAEKDQATAALQRVPSADAPAGSSTHSTDNPAAAMTRLVAAVTSGPIPSPGIKTIVCLAIARP